MSWNLSTSDQRLNNLFKMAALVTVQQVQLSGELI